MGVDMKKIVFTIISLILLFSASGCGKEVTVDELNAVNNKIIEHFTSDEALYDNLTFNYVDVTNMKVVVGLLENTKEQQKKFKDMVVDSKYLEFVQGENFNVLEDYMR